MKKVTTALVLAFIGSTSLCNAQSFETGTNVVAVGVGLGSSIFNYSGSSQTPAISISFEHGTFDAGEDGVISLGGYLGTKSYKYSNKDAGYSYSEKWNYTIVGLRGAYHYTGFDNDKLDAYGGIMLSYNILKYSYKDNSGNSGGYSSAGSYGSRAGFTAFIGGRYYFSDNIAAMAELGYGVSYLTLGLAFKF